MEKLLPGIYSRDQLLKSINLSNSDLDISNNDFNKNNNNNNITTTINSDTLSSTTSFKNDKERDLFVRNIIILII